LSIRIAEPRTATGPVAARALATWVPYAVLVAAAWWAMLAAMPAGPAPAGHAHGASHAGPALSLGMWATMTLAMMAPTAVPMLRALIEVLAGRGLATWWGFVGGYGVAWLGWSAVAAAVQGAVGAWGGPLVGTEAARWGGAAVLAAAGLYQFTSLKDRCLTECLRPMTFLLAHWREGLRGGLAMGVRHGAACVGCCWALMALAFVGSLWSAASMAVLTGLMVVEKAPAVGRRLTAPIGVVLVAAAALRAI
jgi:predicted metal-binding membrane protein